MWIFGASVIYVIISTQHDLREILQHISMMAEEKGSIIQKWKEKERERERVALIV